MIEALLSQVLKASADMDRLAAELKSVRRQIRKLEQRLDAIERAKQPATRTRSAGLITRGALRSRVIWRSDPESLAREDGQP